MPRYVTLMVALCSLLTVRTVLTLLAWKPLISLQTFLAILHISRLITAMNTLNLQAVYPCVSERALLPFEIISEVNQQFDSPDAQFKKFLFLYNFRSDQVHLCISKKTLKSSLEDTKTIAVKLLKAIFPSSQTFGLALGLVLV